MRLVLAPQLEVRWERRTIDAPDLAMMPTVDIADGSDELLADLITQAIRDRPDLTGSHPDVDAPPFAPDSWWVATIQTGADRINVDAYLPAHFYGINEHRVCALSFLSRRPPRWRLC